jgi:uncharacterized protein (UPF0264 family)
MMRLMISVVSAEEANEALTGGAEILDIKNPEEGSLGAQSPSVIREIKSLASGRLEVSAAIGDMPNLPGTAALAALGAAYCGADYVKVGLLGPRNEAEAIALLQEMQAAVQDFPTSVIAALYADYARAHTLNPRCLPAIASKAGIRGCLLDTAIKDGRSLLEFLDEQALGQLIDQAHGNGLLIGLAGCLRANDLRLMQDLGADIVGMRTAACRDNQRRGPLEAARVHQLRRILVPVV